MPRAQRPLGLPAPKKSKPKGSKHRALPPEVAHWQRWVKLKLQERKYTQEELAGRLRLSPSGLVHRLNLRAEWHPHDLRDLGEMIGVTMDEVMENYPDIRFLKWEDNDVPYEPEP